MHWRPGYLVPSVWGSTSGLPTEEERRALLGVVVAIPGYLLSGSSGHTSEPCLPSIAIAPLLFSPPLLLRQWLFLCTPFGSAFLSAAALASFIGLYLHLLQGHSSQHHRLVFEIFFISVVIGICGAEHLIPAALLLCQLGLIPARVHVLMPFHLHGGLLPLVCSVRSCPGSSIAQFLLLA